VWHRLKGFLRANRVEIKYVVLALTIMGVMATLASQRVFNPIEGPVNRAMNRLADHGLLGMFLLSLVSNMTLVIQVPYNMPLFSLVIYADTLWGVVALGMATALGAGLGATFSYAVARTIVARVDDLDQSALFRATRSAIERRPYLIPLFVWFASSTPIPDFSIIVPLAMVRYPWQKLMIPMVIGKITNNVTVALAFRFATNRMAHYVSGDINFDVTATIAILFVLLIAYQVESAHKRVQNEAARADSK